ncbi:MAG: hypothetical protein ACREBB_04695 [Nitrosotalea sp.]
MTKDDQGRNVIEAKTLDGIALKLVEIPEDKELTKIPYHPKLNTEKNNRKHPDSEQIYT